MFTLARSVGVINTVSFMSRKIHTSVKSERPVYRAACEDEYRPLKSIEPTADVFELFFCEISQKTKRLNRRLLLWVEEAVKRTSFRKHLAKKGHASIVARVVLSYCPIVLLSYCTTPLPPFHRHCIVPQLHAPPLIVLPPISLAGGIVELNPLLDVTWTGAVH